MKCRKNRLGLFFALLFALIAVNGTFMVSGAPETDNSSVFASYRQNQESHPNIPDNSYAGYQYGEKSLCAIIS